MARYIPSLPIEDCYGSVGDVTFYHRDGKCFYKDRIRPDFPGTMRQMEQQQVHLRAIAAWQGLPSSVQKEWNAISPDVIVHRPPFDGMAHMSGYNLFVSAYHGFATLGDEHVPEPTPWVDFPAVVLELVEEVSAASGSLVIRMKAYLEVCAMAEHCRFLMRLQLVEPGRGRDPGKMRNCLAVEVTRPGYQVVTFIVKDYVSLFGLDLQEYTMHCRYMLLDSQTGYRNLWKPASFQVKL